MKFHRTTLQDVVLIEMTPGAERMQDDDGEQYDLDQ